MKLKFKNLIFGIILSLLAIGFNTSPADALGVWQVIGSEFFMQVKQNQSLRHLTATALL